jgi:hypothetical protein
MAFIDEQPGVDYSDPGLEEPADNVQDAFGNWLYIQNAEGYWYNNPAFGSSAPVVERLGDDGVSPDQDTYSSPPPMNTMPGWPNDTTDAAGDIQVWGIYQPSPGVYAWEVTGTRDKTTNEFTPITTGGGATPGTTDDDAFNQLRSDYEGLSTQLQNLIADAKEKASVDRKSAYDTLHDLFVVELGLPLSLLDNVMEWLIEGDSDLAVTQKLRASTEYKDRFPVMAKRATLGLPRLSEATVLKMERAYRSSMRQAGLPDPPLDYMTLWLVGDVSDAELQTRIALAETAVRTANTETKQQLQDLYGIDNTDLLNYYLNPDDAQDIFEARLQLEAAGISAASVRGAGAALEVDTAERLQASGVQAREVEQRLGRRAGLLEDLIGSEGLAVDELAEGEFGTDLEAATELQRLTAERLSAFQGTGGVLAGRGGITGLGSAST